jgi:8-oxo-dGTP pyrophosphatase MutT (NUDIX family)
VQEIRAAGGVVVGDDGRIAVVHRPRHEDWSLPKGKLDGDETWEEAALREVEEECGLRCRLLEELTTSRYEVRGRPKVVRWWRMAVTEDLGFAADDEVDELRWVSTDEAAELLSYEPDRALVAAVTPASSQD